MKIHFYSFSDTGNVSYDAECEFSNNTYSFKEEESNSLIKFTINSDGTILMNRIGENSLSMLFDLDKLTKSHFKNSMGLEFDFTVNTKEINITTKGFMVNYTYYVDEKTSQNVKICLLVK